MTQTPNATAAAAARVPASTPTTSNGTALSTGDYQRRATIRALSDADLQGIVDVYAADPDVWESPFLVDAFGWALTELAVREERASQVADQVRRDAAFDLAVATSRVAGR